VANIESNRDKDPNWWNIFGLGLKGRVTGLVHPHFEQVPGLPWGDPIYGLDYGFESDPTVFVKNILIGDKCYSQQMFYDYTSLTNGQIAQKMALCGVKPAEPIFPDPSQPQSAAELRQMGFNVLDSVKGKGSVEFGIKRVNEYYQYWTQDSLECIKDQRNYRWIEDRDNPGEYTNRTTHRWSHGPDARRYPVATYVPHNGARERTGSAY
jgi:phage terminase large subunit